jgi:nitrite reductase/ring-hydroxylating ferredoxin subunit
VAFEPFREPLVLWRGPNGRVVAAPDKCSHRSSNLSPGVVENGCLICPHHGRVFGEDGRCLLIPARPGAVDESAHLATFACEERHGLVWVCLGDPHTEIPTVAVDGDPTFHRANAVPAIWNAPAPRILEALGEQGFTDGSESGYDLPFTYRRSVSTGDGSEALLLVTCSPLGANTSLVFVVLWSLDAATSSEDLLDAALTALTALRPAVEAVPGMYEIDENAPDSGTDGTSAWRRAFLEVVTAQV